MPRIIHMTDLHLDDWPGNLPGMVARIEGRAADIFLIGGDNGGEARVVEIVRALRGTHPKAAIAWIMGNHDLWDRPIDDVWRDHVVPGARYLETGNLETDACTVVGTYGHYDHSGGDPNIPDEIYEQYRFGNLGWNDRYILRDHRTNPEIAGEIARRFAVRYRRALARRLPVVVLMHTLAFEELNAWGRNFYGAYGTNSLIGDEILKYDPKPVVLFCGHTHNPIRVETRGFPMINTGSDYNRVRISTFEFD
uniref:Calcineurin-like phosphoesterase n=1 Tax=Candidatus Kentrum sp. SD TaxID=2126332 RepID=A0A451BLL6_9GAMM|nr:MAG: Calcineurin-like phosphoesterase [Candidatus Kentron sp. SD]VFK49590.1 MAG: Calcineurin-like phosphoesterase [Candidatus Kentron sp. SD]VFK79192.1 MAG: Calcineurin-like phosphoesterase [Candidatus Kentron sp. SD]